MKGFALDEYGDVIIEQNDVKLTYDTELLIQKIRQVLNTNRGEWWLDPKEGIPVQKVLKRIRTRQWSGIMCAAQSPKWISRWR